MRSLLSDIVTHHVVLTQPTRLTISAWQGHIPFAMYLVDVQRPGRLVELGTHYGDSYCAFCQAVKQLSLDCACYAVDTWRGDPQAGLYGPEVLADLQRHHDPLYGSFSTLLQSTFDEAAKHFSPGSVDLLHIDGCHFYDAVKHDFETWFPMLSTRGVVLFHDTNERRDEYGAWRFWEEIRMSFPHFEFLHSHGLGLLAVGPQQPPEIRNLCACGYGDADEIRTLFERLGSPLVLRTEIELLHQQNTALQASINRSRALRLVRWLGHFRRGA